MTQQERLRQLEAEALELQQTIRSKYPTHVPEPWPEELVRLQGRLWELGYEITREKERLGSSPQTSRNPMTPAEIDQVANKVAAKVLEEVSPAILDPAGRGMLLHFTEHEMLGGALIVNEAKARASPCKIFTYKGREYGFSPGAIGMMTGEQVEEYCKVGKTYEEKPAIKSRFEKFAEAREEAAKKAEGYEGTEKLKVIWRSMGEELEKRGIEV